MAETIKAADRDMTRKSCHDCKHYNTNQYSYQGDCTRKEYGPRPDEWCWLWINGWQQLPAPVVKSYICCNDNADGHCPGFDEKPPKVEAPAAPEPTTGEKLAALIYEMAAEAQVA
jgi:hypothetical protein